MRIAMVDPSLFTGRYDDSLCAALARRGHAVRLLGRPLRATDAIVPQGYAYLPRFFRVGEAARGLLGDGSLGRAAKALDYAFDVSFGPLGALAGDIVHVQWLPFPGADARLLARLAGRAALIHTVHNADAYHGDSGAQGRGYAALLRRFDALIVHGAATRAALVERGFDPARIHAVPHPPMRLAAANEAERAAVPAPAGVPRILFFGTIRPYKGLDLLVEAALALWAEGIDFELALAGKPFMAIDALLARVRAAGQSHRLIADLGFLTEGRLDAHLACADIVAFPYRAIDSSGAFLSALGYGAAMVTSDAGMFGELAEGASARFPAGDAAALAGVLRPLLRDKAARNGLGAAALRLHAALDDWDDAAAWTERVYDAALAGRRAR